MRRRTRSIRLHLGGLKTSSYSGDIVVHGSAGDFLAEYMAGGRVVLLGGDTKVGGFHRASHVGTGMHGGKLYVHGELAGLGREAFVRGLNEQDRSTLNELITDFSKLFKHDPKEVMSLDFYKMVPNLKDRIKAPTREQP
ncbi:hypothetical protein KEJ39_03045 [Candidatus Bathyarchaeota archaeon]|nr:hypothetical protein [Candidatus Bathyarchaeota archaeon]